MPLFLTNTLKKASGGGAATENNIYQTELDILKNKYQDTITGEITNQEYFDKARATIKKAVSDPGLTGNQKNNFLVKALELDTEEQKWSVTNNKYYGDVRVQIENEIKDNWTSIWQNKDILQSGNTQVMSVGMSDSLDAAKSELETLLADVQSKTTDESTLATIQDNIDYIDQQATFWRGLATSPQDYAINYDTDANGRVRDLKVTYAANVPEGFKQTDAMLGDVRIYAKPNPTLTDDKGNQVIKIGNNIFTSDSDKNFTIGQGKQFDTKSISNIMFGNYSPNSVFKSSSGEFKVLQNDGSFIKFANDQELTQAGFKPDDAISITDADSSKIDNMYKVSTPKQIDNQKKIQQAQQETIDKFKDQTSVWWQFRHTSPSEAISNTGEAIKGAVNKNETLKKVFPFFSENNPNAQSNEGGIRLTPKGQEMVNTASSAVKGFIKDRTTDVKNIWGGIFKQK